MYSAGNLWILEASLSQLEKFQLSSALPDIKYNCAILFLCEMYIMFIMVVYEKIYFKAYTNDLYISHKNNIAQAVLELFQYT